MGEDVSDASLTQGQLRFGRALATLFVGIPLIPLTLFFASALAWGSEAGLIGLAFGFVLGAPLAVVGTRMLLRVSQAWGRVIEMIHEEWRTGRVMLPEWLIQAHPEIARWRETPAIEEADSLRLKRAVLLEKWGPRLLAVSFTGFVILYPTSLYSDWRGPVPVAATVLATFLPLATALSLRVLAGPGVTLLARIREYEKAMGMRLLPETVREGP